MIPRHFLLYRLFIAFVVAYMAAGKHFAFLMKMKSSTIYVGNVNKRIVSVSAKDVTKSVVRERDPEAVQPLPRRD